MNFKADIESTLEDLKGLGYDRRRVEKEIRYSPYSLDQLISKGGNEKLLVILSLLKKSIELENELSKQASPDADVLNRLEQKIDAIDANLIHTRHVAELNQALGKANLFQSANLEALMTKSNQRNILERLNEVTLQIFDEMQNVLNPTNESRPVVS